MPPLQLQTHRVHREASSAEGSDMKCQMVGSAVEIGFEETGAAVADMIRAAVPTFLGPQPQRSDS